MADVWFVLVSVLLTAYVVLDGFDLGAATLLRVVADGDCDRGTVIAVIRPYWDSNEVFLVAAGGTLLLAFSRALAAALSGLYLAVMLVLWAILLRAMSIELRSHLREPLWRAFWDVVLPLSSGLLALLFGVTLGNVLRGFPLEADGYFALDLFSLGSPRLARGVVDAYTLPTGVFALVVLVGHGARFLAWKTDGAVKDRSRRIADSLGIPTLTLWAGVTWLTQAFAAPTVHAFASRTAAWPLVATAIIGLAGARALGRRGRDRDAFLSSAVFVVSLVGLAAASTYPVLLRSTTDAASLTTANAASGEGSLVAGTKWWFFAAILVALYFWNLFRQKAGNDPDV